MNVRWTPAALADLADLQEYIARDSPGAADRMAQRVRHAVEDLADNPLKGRLGRIPGTRELVIPRTSQIVAYTVRGDFVEILALIHAARRWPESFE